MRYFCPRLFWVYCLAERSFWLHYLDTSVPAIDDEVHAVLLATRAGATAGRLCEDFLWLAFATISVNRSTFSSVTRGEVTKEQVERNRLGNQQNVGVRMTVTFCSRPVTNSTRHIHTCVN